MEEFKRVYVTTDDDGHNYIIPYEMKDDFEKDLEAGSIDEYDDFIEKYEQYATGGDINLEELYIKIK